MAKLDKIVTEDSYFNNLDIDALTRTCDSQLTHSEGLVASPEFSKRIDALISAAKKKLASGYVVRHLAIFSRDHWGCTDDAHVTQGNHLLHRVWTRVTTARNTRD